MPNLQKKRFNEETRDAIESYIAAGGENNEEGIVLTKKQEDYLIRWRFADERFRQNKYKTDRIANFLMDQFKISRDTAYKDIVNAQRVFRSTCPLNKQYEIQGRIEDLKVRIYDAYIDNDRIGAAMLDKVLQKYLEMYSDVVPVRSPKNIVFNIQNNLFVTDKTPRQSYADADEIIKALENDDRDIS